MVEGGEASERGRTRGGGGEEKDKGERRIG